MKFKKVPIHVHKAISEKTGLNVNRVEKILAHGVADWYKSILENAQSKVKSIKQYVINAGIPPESLLDIEASSSVNDLGEAATVFKRFEKNGLSIGQLPESIPEGLRIFLSVVDLAARETGESRENILKVSKAMYELEN